MDSGDDTQNRKFEQVEPLLTWLIIIIVLLVAFGPVLWLVPSRKDRRLAGLRERARREGFIVELAHLPDPEPTPQQRVSAGGRLRDPIIECAAYTHIMTGRLRWLPDWRLLRVALTTEGPRPGWVFETGCRPDRDHLTQMLEVTDPVLDSLPPDVVGLAVADRHLTAYWLEQPASNEAAVARLMVLFRAWEGRLEALDGEINTAKMDEDS